MSPALNAIRKELMAYAPSDPVMTQVLKCAWEELMLSDAAGGLEELHLTILNPESASPDLMSSYYFTETCQALRDEMMIIVNENFLLELEAAIRSFALSHSLLGSPYLKGDNKLFGLVRSIRMNQKGYVKRLRRWAAKTLGDPKAEDNIRKELILITLYFLGHELGHLRGGHGVGQYGTFVDPSLPKKDRIDAAVVKLCCHVDEFNKYKFGLQGFEQISERGTQVRRNIDEYRARDVKRFQRQQAFFINEAEADECANSIIIEYLNRLEESSPIESEICLFLFGNAIFVAALYSWYRDLLAFGQKLGFDSTSDAKTLTIKMMQSREHYLYGAELFGEFHRFTLLRAALALETVLRAQTTWFEQQPDVRRIHCPYNNARIASDLKARREWWLSESLKRYSLLCISMDTAVKIANIGASTGWLKNADRERGFEQMLVMRFEPIGTAVEMLNRIP